MIKVGPKEFSEVMINNKLVKMLNINNKKAYELYGQATELSNGENYVTSNGEKFRVKEEE